MEQTALLSPSDVSVIRRYVQTKYAPLSGTERADIVATAIRQTLERRLPDLPAEVKVRIANELIRRCLLMEKRDIRPDDVLDACAEIELADPADEYMILDPVLRWMNERDPGVWSAERLIARLFKRRLPPAVFEEEAAAVVAQAAAAVELSEEFYPPNRSRLAAAWDAIPRPALGLAVLVLAGGLFTGLWLGRPAMEEPVAIPPPILASPQPSADIGMPESMKYRDIDTEAVQTFLKSRDSVLADEPYFGAIVDSARDHNVNPLLLFAITGQEQGFVPKSNKNALEIANNPFNVYHSWEQFNTDIARSADIAARTISRRGNKRPEGHEPFLWLNITYAEDPNWATGVKKIFDRLNGLSTSSPSRNPSQYR